MKTNTQSKPGQAYVKTLVMCALLISLCLSGISTQAYIISDNFDLTGGARVSGAPLNGATTMTGGATWVANSPMTFGGTAPDGYLSFSAADYGNAGVSLTSAATDTVALQADMHPNGEGAWLGMRIGTTSGWSTTEGAFVLVNSSASNNGFLQVFTNGFNIFNFSASSYSYDPSGLNQYFVEYNGTTKKLSLWANSVQLMTNYELTGTNIPGIISYAGLLDCMNAANQDSFDNFQVSVVSVPEPATLSLLVIGVLSMMRRQQKTMRH